VIDFGREDDNRNEMKRNANEWLDGGPKNQSAIDRSFTPSFRNDDDRPMRYDEYVYIYI